jgi:hypothetical protein
VTDSDGGNGKQAVSSVVAHVVAAAGSDKRQAWPPMDRFEKLLEETCPNHAYPIKHKLRDYDMMKNFMASVSLTWGMEINDVPNEGDATPFSREDTVMTIYDGRPTMGMRRVSNPSPGIPAHNSWGRTDVGM